VKIIFVTIAYPRTSSEFNLYTDLMEEFAEHGHEVYVVCSIEKRFGQATNLTQANGIKVLRVQTGNITSNPNLITKGLALLQLQSVFITAIDRYFKELTFDLVIYSTPPIQYNRVIRFLKRKSDAVTFLLLKDIFPQNAIDIGLLSKWNPIAWYFRRQEKVTYKLSDRIGCMSPANEKYLLEHNSFLVPGKVSVCPNSLKDRGTLTEPGRTRIRSEIRKKYSIKESDLLLTYGGNLGIPQGLSFLLEILKAYKDTQHLKFLIVGEGTWFDRIEKVITDGNYRQVIIQKRVSPGEFKDILVASDIGLIFLNPRFTIPNFPSRLTSCIEIGLPVIACTDNSSDVGDVVEDSGCGYKVISGNMQRFDSVIHEIMESPDLLKQKSANARALFEKSYTTKVSYSVIMNNLTK